jgi:hypothetical protein
MGDIFRTPLWEISQSLVSRKSHVIANLAGKTARRSGTVIAIMPANRSSLLSRIFGIRESKDAGMRLARSGELDLS